MRVWVGFGGRSRACVRVSALALAWALGGAAFGQTDAPPSPSSPPVAASTPTPAASPAATPAAAATPDASAPAPIPTTAAAPVKPKKRAPPPPPLETALSTDPEPTLQPDTFFHTAKASERYAAIVDAGGWPTDIVALRPGAKGPAVAELRRRLAIEGDLTADVGAPNPVWDDWLTAGVKHFQARMGLRQSGIVAGATLKAMNVPAKVRFKELASSADRLPGDPRPAGPAPPAAPPVRDQRCGAREAAQPRRLDESARPVVTGPRPRGRPRAPRRTRAGRVAGRVARFWAANPGKARTQASRGLRFWAVIPGEPRRASEPSFDSGGVTAGRGTHPPRVNERRAH